MVGGDAPFARIGPQREMERLAEKGTIAKMNRTLQADKKQGEQWAKMFSRPGRKEANKWRDRRAPPPQRTRLTVLRFAKAVGRLYQPESATKAEQRCALTLALILQESFACKKHPSPKDTAAEQPIPR